MQFLKLLTSHMHLHFSLFHLPDLIPKGWKSYHAMQVQHGPIEMYGAHLIRFTTLGAVYKEFLMKGKVMGQVGSMLDRFILMRKLKPHVA